VVKFKLPFIDKLSAAPKRESIHLGTLLYIAWRNFTSKKLRSFLTVFGVVIGVSAVYFLLSFGIGMQQLVTTQVVGDQSLKSIDVETPNSKIIALNEEAINAIRTYPHIENVGILYSFPSITSFDGGEIDVVTFGVDLTYQELSVLNLVGGRLLEASDNKAIVMSESALRALGLETPSEAIGKEISVNIPLSGVEAKQEGIKSSFTIVGVIDAGAGNEAYVPSGLFDAAGVPAYSQVKVVVDDVSNVDSARKQIESRGFQTTSLADTLTEIDDIFRFFNIVLVGFGSVGMIVAILGMFNTLTISLLERTKEIGLMLALGARRRDVRMLFIFEAGLISLAGALAGIALAVAGGLAVNIAVNLNAQTRGITAWFELFVFPPWLFFATVFITLIIGLIVVYIPARRAEKINPIEALRRE
jgi:putative ABC transport system permease protein